MNFYLERYGFIPPQLKAEVHPTTGIIIVIPCFNEDKLSKTLNSLVQCVQPDCQVEVIVVINSGEHHPQEIKEQNLKTLNEFQDFTSRAKSSIHFHLIHQANLPKKHAGVGLARKIGMDEAVVRFESINKDGIIVCFDADAEVEPNYLTAIEQHFEDHPNTAGCSIYFEHPINGNEFEPEVYQGIINYELHLRYYNQALKFAKLPYAFHTVGSSMAVRSSAYQKQGGMNKRKAGEDFYFIHKIIALGNFSELKKTKVIPSPRISDRVPFGTGKAIADWIASAQNEYPTYAFESFQQIQQFVGKIHTLFEGETPFISQPFNDFLVQNDFENRLKEIRQNTTDIESFKKRFFVWFDAFRVLKLVHYLRDNGYPNKLIRSESLELLNLIHPSEAALNTEEELLKAYRKIEKV